MPSFVVVGRMDGQADAAAYFDAQNRGYQGISTAGVDALGYGQGGGQRRRRRVNNRGEVGVVVVFQVAQVAVGQGRIL